MENAILAKMLNGDDRSAYRDVIFLMKLAPKWPRLNSIFRMTEFF